jgi:hypothetical protein
MVTITTTCGKSRDHVFSLLTRTGVFASVYEQKRRSERHKRAWKIVVRRHHAVGRLADLMRPWAVTKADQWAIAAEWAAGRRARGRRLTNSELAQHAQLSERSRALNRRGP